MDELFRNKEDSDAIKKINLDELYDTDSFLVFANNFSSILTNLLLFLLVN